MRSISKQSTSGMTILEVIAVVAIIGILAAIAAPGWLTFANRQRANRATDQVLQSIRSAQADAKRTRRTRTLEFDIDATTNTPLINANGVTTKIGEGDLDGIVDLKVFENVTYDADGNATGGDDITGTKPITFTSTGGLEDLNLPVQVTISIPKDDGVKKCVAVRSLLGATQLGRDAECQF